MNKPLILVVEDDAPVRNLITTTLKAHDYKFITAQNGNNAIMELVISSATSGNTLVVAELSKYTSIPLSPLKRERYPGEIPGTSFFIYKNIYLVINLMFTVDTVCHGFFDPADSL